MRTSIHRHPISRCTGVVFILCGTLGFVFAALCRLPDGDAGLLLVTSAVLGLSGLCAIAAKDKTRS